MENKEQVNEKCDCGCKCGCKFPFIIIIIVLILAFAGYALYKEGIIFKSESKGTSCNCKKESTKCDVDDKEVDAKTLYTNYLTNLKDSIKKNYKDYSNNVVLYESEATDINYTFTITKDLELKLSTSDKKYTDKKVSDDVVSMFLVSVGNGGYKNLYFIKTDGTLNYVCVDCISENEKVEIKKQDLKNIVLVTDGLFDYQYSGAAGAIFVDIQGNTYQNK